jgi:hypothetical protein
MKSFPSYKTFVEITRKPWSSFLKGIKQDHFATQSLHEAHARGCDLRVLLGYLFVFSHPELAEYWHGWHREVADLFIHDLIALERQLLNVSAEWVRLRRHEEWGSVLSKMDELNVIEQFSEYYRNCLRRDVLPAIRNFKTEKGGLNENVLLVHSVEYLKQCGINDFFHAISSIIGAGSPSYQEGHEPNALRKRYERYVKTNPECIEEAKQSIAELAHKKWPDTIDAMEASLRQPSLDTDG